MYNLIALALIDCIFFITYNSKLKSKLKKKSKENMLKKEFEKDSGKGCDGAQRKRKKNFEFFLVKKQTSLPKTAEIAKSHLYLLQVTVVTESRDPHTRRGGNAFGATVGRCRAFFVGSRAFGSRAWNARCGSH